MPRRLFRAEPPRLSRGTQSLSALWRQADRAIQSHGFIVLPGWINRARRLAKDFEATIEFALAWIPAQGTPRKALSSGNVSF